MFLAEGDGQIRSPNTSTYSIDGGWGGGGGGRCRALKISSSVFPLFTFSLLFTIHESISETHAKCINIHQKAEATPFMGKKFKLCRNKSDVKF